MTIRVVGTEGLGPGIGVVWALLRCGAWPCGRQYEGRVRAVSGGRGKWHGGQLSTLADGLASAKGIEGGFRWEAVVGSVGGGLQGEATGAGDGA